MPRYNSDSEPMNPRRVTLTQTATAPRDMAALIVITVLAVVARIVFFTGFFGSDEVTYLEAAVATLHGTWQRSTYIGSLRLGVNVPIAAVIRIFGPSEASAAAWGFASSVLEVCVVYWLGLRLGGRRLAVAASLILATLPLHVHLAGRIMADPPLAVLMTLSFVLLLEATLRESRGFYIAAGACTGAVYWVKEATTIFVVLLVVWMLWRRLPIRYWLWFAGAFTSMIAVNFAVMWAYTGSPMHLIDALLASMRRYSDPSQLVSISDDRSAAFYLRYLFVDVWHTWLLGPLSLAGAILAIFRLQRVRSGVTAYVLLWGVGLLLLFSLFPVGLLPLRLIPKQTNYMALFFAPLALLAASLIVNIRNSALRGGVLALTITGNLALGGLEQQTIHAFTHNSMATATWMGEHRADAMYLVTNAERYNLWLRLTQSTSPSPHGNVLSLSALSAQKTRQGACPRAQASADAYAIVDQQTLGWGANGLNSIADVPESWERVLELRREARITAGRTITAALQGLAGSLPVYPASQIYAKLQKLLEPSPATVYRISRGSCI